MKRALLAAFVFASLCWPNFAGAQQKGLAPVLAGQDWFNARPTPADLAGKVVLVDVFTFGCINCKHVTPELQHLHAAVPARDLAIVGVHSPETGYERERANAIAEFARQGIAWPVVIDNSLAIWRALGIEYWPTQLIFDRHGVLRKTIVGEGQDRIVERTVRALIAEPAT